MDGPFSRPTRSVGGQDRRGSPRFRDASVSARAVLSDPAGVSSPLASCGSLLVPSKFSTLSASGFPNHEAQSLHLRYGPDVALPTLSPCRYLHEPKARFQVGRLIPLAWAGIAPAGSARLRLAHQSSHGFRIQHVVAAPRAVHCGGASKAWVDCASAGSHTTKPGSRTRRSVPARSWPPSARPDPVPSECRGAAAGHRPWECIAAGPAADGTCLRAARRGARRACTPLRTARRDRASHDRRPPRRGSPSPAAMPPTGRHACRSDPAGHGSGAPGCLAATQRRRCNWRTLSMGGCPPGWLDLAVMPSRVLARPPCPPQGPFVPLALFVARLCTTTIPSDARCAALDFTVGLYEPRCPDPGCADGPLVFLRLPVRVLRPVPRRDLPRDLRTETRQTWPSPRRDRLGSRVVNLSRLQASRNVAPSIAPRKPEGPESTTLGRPRRSPSG